MTSTPEWSPSSAIDRLLPDLPAESTHSSSKPPMTANAVKATAPANQPGATTAVSSHQLQSALTAVQPLEPANTFSSSTAVAQTAAGPAVGLAIAAPPSFDRRARAGQAAHKRSAGLHKAAMDRLLQLQQKAASNAAAVTSAVWSAVSPAAAVQAESVPSQAADSSAMPSPKAAAAPAAAVPETATHIDAEPVAEAPAPVMQPESTDKPQLKVEPVAEVSSATEVRPEPVAPGLSKHKRKVAAKQARKKPAAAKGKRQAEDIAVQEVLPRCDFHW